MGSLLDDPALVEHHDPVHPGDGGQAVGDDQGRGVAHQEPQGLLDQVLGLGVESGRGLVEHEDRRPLGHGLGDRHPLALAARQLEPAFADDRVVPVGQLADELLDVGRPPHLVDQVVVDGTIDPAERASSAPRP